MNAATEKYRSENPPWQAHAFREDWLRLGGILGFNPCSPPLMVSAVHEGVVARAGDGYLMLGEMIGGTADRSAVLHELGHLMVTDDERVGAKSWGMTTASVLSIGHGLLKESMTTGAIRHEAGAWAWQSILHGILDVPQLDERGRPIWSAVVYMPNTHLLGNSNSAVVEATGRIVEGNIARIIADHGGIEGAIQAISERIAILPHLLAARREFELDLKQAGETVEQARASAEDNPMHIIQSSWTGVSGKPVYAVEAVLHDRDGNMIDSTLLAHTRSQSKAERTFSWNARLHEMDIIHADSLNPAP